MAAIELAQEFREEVEQYALELKNFNTGRVKGAEKPTAPKPNIRFLNRNIFDHVLVNLKAIRSAELESTLRFLNYR